MEFSLRLAGWVHCVLRVCLISQLGKQLQVFKSELRSRNVHARAVPPPSYMACCVFWCPHTAKVACSVYHAFVFPFIHADSKTTAASPGGTGTATPADAIRKRWKGATARVLKVRSVPSLVVALRNVF